jgi:hypothetical protein
MSPRLVSVQTWPKERTSWIRTSSTTAIPTRFGAVVDDPSQPFTVEFEVLTRDGRRPEVTELVLSVRDTSAAESITTESLRQVQVAGALTLAIAKVTIKVVDNGDGTFLLPDDTTGSTSGDEAVPRPVRGTSMTPEFLKLVAETYRAAVASGSRSPVEDLRRELGASRSTAGRWVLRARKDGYLREAIGRIAGESANPPKKSRS